MRKLLPALLITPIALVVVAAFLIKIRTGPYSIIQLDNFSGREVHNLRVIVGDKEECVSTLAAGASKDLKFLLTPGTQMVVAGPDEATTKRFEFNVGTDKKELECIRLVLNERCNISREKGHLFILF